MNRPFVPKDMKTETKSGVVTVGVLEDTTSYRKVFTVDMSSHDEPTAIRVYIDGIMCTLVEYRWLPMKQLIQLRFHTAPKRGSVIEVELE